eukprot:Pgem_evm1s12278
MYFYIKYSCEPVQRKAKECLTTQPLHTHRYDYNNNSCLNMKIQCESQGPEFKFNNRYYMKTHTVYFSV